MSNVKWKACKNCLSHIQDCSYKNFEKMNYKILLEINLINLTSSTFRREAYASWRLGYQDGPNIFLSKSFCLKTIFLKPLQIRKLSDIVFASLYKQKAENFWCNIRYSLNGNQTDAVHLVISIFFVFYRK